MQHVGVASWFRCLCNAQSDFAAKERIVWVDIKGISLNAWSHSTFQKITSKWGEMVELEDGYDDLFINEEANSLNNDVEESDSDVVSDTYFSDNGEDQGLEHQQGSKAKKDWIRELISKHEVSFLSIQETKMDSVSAMEVKFLWVYTPQSVSSKRMLWSYLASLITSWNGESLIMGDFNRVRCIEERWGSVFNVHGANAFNSFISN
nr:RNA-directed DNA polymerase, eukaryota [Tanacetum cinerariifolium]